MTIDISDVVSELRVAGDAGQSAVQLGRLSRELLGSRFGPISFIASFAQAFGMPLGVLKHAQSWHEFHDPGVVIISDEEFEDLLRPWLPKAESAQ